MDQKAQAALELAVFGAIVIFLIGSILRTAVGNSYTQNQDFKAMRMAMLLSWEGSEAQSTSRNSASVMIIEDRLSPDFNKYGALDRNPFIASGTGSFSYQMLYPLDPSEVDSNLPIMDMYINGKHFPFTTAAWVPGALICPPGSAGCPIQACPGQAQSAQQARLNCLKPCKDSPDVCGAQCESVFEAQCNINQCWRNEREWVGGHFKGSDFQGVIPVTPSTVITNCSCLTHGESSCPSSAVYADERLCQDQTNAAAIFHDLTNVNVITNVNWNGSDTVAPAGVNWTGDMSSVLPTSDTWSAFTPIYDKDQNLSGQTNQQIKAIENIVNTKGLKYKLFYTMAANGAGDFSPAPSVAGSGITDALTSNIITDNNQVPPMTSTWNTGADMKYDLLRMGDYSAVDTQFGPPVTSCAAAVCQPSEGTCPGSSTSLRCNIAWQWVATKGMISGDTTDGADPAIGLDPDSNTYPTYDVNGTLKEVTVYAISPVSNNGWVKLDYEDPSQGDIDPTWDTNTCGPKPGLMNDVSVYTATNNGTYLEIKEGSLYNPEQSVVAGQLTPGGFVRSANQRDTIDLVQREIQLSHDTHRFCSGTSEVPLGQVVGTSEDNPVELCIPPPQYNPKGDTCFSSEQNIKSTCLDENTNILFVRSRLEDRRGHNWFTDVNGQLKVQ